MGRRARFGLLIALAGLLLPIVALPFTKGQVPLAGFLYNINRMEVVLYEGKRPVSGAFLFERYSDQMERIKKMMKEQEEQRRFEEERIAFPYRYCLLGGAAFVFGGLAMFILSYKKEVMKGS